MKIRTDQLCLACTAKEETSRYFVRQWTATLLSGYSLFGAYIIRPKDLRQVTPSSLLRFARSPKSVFKTFGYMLNVQWTNAENGLSIGWLKNHSP